MRVPAATVEAESAIFSQLYPRLRRFAAVAGPVEVDPDDIVQDALERTLRQSSLASLDNPYAYLCRVVLNLSSNHRRRLAVRRRALWRLVKDDVDVPSYPSDVEMLLALSGRDRTILYLREVEGYKHAEIAELLGVSEATASKAAERALARLTRIVERGQQ